MNNLPRRGRPGSRLALAALLLLSLPGCPRQSELPPVTAPEDAPSPARKDELFVRDPETGKTVFSTNDPANWSENGYTIWTISGSEDEAFSSMEAELAKTEGDPTAGFGIVFCHHLTPEGETALVLMLNASGEYVVGELLDGRFREIITWTSSSEIKPDLNRANRVGVALADGEFILSMNGAEVGRFRDEEAPFHERGGRGYVVVISPLDDFPRSSVTVVFGE